MSLRRAFDKATLESVFLFSFAINMFSNIFGATQWAYSADDAMTPLLWGLKAIRYLSYLLFFFKIVIDSYGINRKGLLCILAVFFPVVISTIKSSDRLIFLFALIILAAKNFSAKRLIRCVLSVQTAVVCVTVLCSQIGIVEDYIKVEQFRTRHYLGFRWSNVAPTFFFFMVLEYLFLHRGKIKLYQYGFLALIDFWFFKMTGSRLAFAATLFCLTFALVYSLLADRVPLARWKWRGGDKVFVLLPWLCATFSIWCHAAYDPANPVWAKINTMLSSRLFLGNNAIRQYGFTAFGQNIKWVGQSIESISQAIEGYNYVDCDYLQIALQYGVIVLILFLLGGSCLMAKAYREKQYYLCWILAAGFVYSMVEPRLHSYSYNPFLLLLLSSLTPQYNGSPLREIQKNRENRSI